MSSRNRTSGGTFNWISPNFGDHQSSSKRKRRFQSRSIGLWSHTDILRVGLGPTRDKGFTHRSDKFLVVERLNEESDRTDSHGGGACGQIFARRDNDNAWARGKRAHSRENLETGHSIHPDIGHYHTNGVHGGVS